MVNDWSKTAQYYDLILDKRSFNKNVQFITKTLNKHNCKTILETGCGTGLYTLPLKKNGFAIEGLDISKQMLSELKKQNKNIPLYKKSMVDFSLAKKFDAIICLTSTLVLLPNLKLIQKAIANFAKHLKPGGILILENPNHEVEIAQADKQQEHERYMLNDGYIDFIFRTYKKNRYWIEEWFGFGFEKGRPVACKEIFTEYIIDPKKMEETLLKHFTIRKKYGSRTGSSFIEDVSRKRGYICIKD